MAKDDEDLLRFAKQSRSAGTDDNVVELMRPLGLVLNQDDDNNVYVETVAPRGNAARTGMVKEGDYVTMCSATFGDQMWSTRGVGLTRVLAAIRVRAGPTVSAQIAQRLSIDDFLISWSKDDYLSDTHTLPSSTILFSSRSNWFWKVPRRKSERRP